MSFYRLFQYTGVFDYCSVLWSIEQSWTTISCVICYNTFDLNLFEFYLWVEILIGHKRVFHAEVFILSWRTCLLRSCLEHSQLLDDVRDGCLLQDMLVALGTTEIRCIWLATEAKEPLGCERRDVELQRLEWVPLNIILVGLSVLVMTTSVVEVVSHNELEAAEVV